MRKSLIRIITGIGVLFIVGVGWFAWQLWMVTGYYSGILWKTSDGGLELTYSPGKPHLVPLQVTSFYVPGAERIWIKVMPGATERRIGRIDVPTPEVLFARAQVHFDRDTDWMALCRYYPFATESQRLNIDARVEKWGGLSEEARACFAAQKANKQ